MLYMDIPHETKPETRNYLQSFYIVVKNHFNTTVKTIWSDNGLEFDMQAFYNQHDILHQKRCAYTPQQNSIVERKHQHILNVARYLRFQAHLPIHFWSDCLFTVVYIINRIPTPLLKNWFRFELLYTKQPVYTHIKIFGCLAYVSTQQHTRHKYFSRSSPRIFLGYPTGIKIYKLFDHSTHKIIISRHVFLWNCVSLSKIPS